MAHHAEPIFVGDFTEGLSILRNDLFRVDHPFRATRHVFGPTVVDTEGSGHVMRKRGWLSAFSRQAVAAEGVQAIIRQSIDEGLAEARRENDLMLAATYIPNRVVLLMLGCPDVDPIDHAKRVRPVIAFLENNVKTPELAEAKAYLREGPLRAAETELFDLPEKERLAELVLLAVAGSESTAVAMKVLIRFWARENETFKAEFAGMAPDDFILKLLRRDPPLGVATRHCAADVSVGDRRFAKGDIVHVDLVETNGRCPESYRAGADLTFGTGKHSCPGHLLAKSELIHVSRRLIDMDLDDFTLEESPELPRAMNFRHPTGLAIRYRARAA